MSPPPLDDAAFDRLTPAIRDDVIVEHIGLEAVAWAHRSTVPWHLDTVAAVVVQLLDGRVSLGELVDDVSDVLGIPEAIARRRIRVVIATLENGDLLRPARSPTMEGDEPDLFVAPPNP